MLEKSFYVSVPGVACIVKNCKIRRF